MTLNYRDGVTVNFMQPVCKMCNQPLNPVTAVLVGGFYCHPAEECKAAQIFNNPDGSKAPMPGRMELGEFEDVEPKGLAAQLRQQSKCLRGEHEAHSMDVYTVPYRGLRAQAYGYPSQEVKACRHCRCLYVSKE